MVIALLEDDLAIQEMLRLVLECAGHEVTIFATAEECLMALQVTAHTGSTYTPDLLIADLRLPKAVSGTTVIELIRADLRLSALPIILMTASVFPNKQELERLQVTLLPKPFDIEKVLRMVDELTASSS